MQNTETDWKQAWEAELRQVVMNKITDLKKTGIIGIEYSGFIKKIIPPPGGPIEKAKAWEKEKATQKYLEMLSHIISNLPEEFKGFIYEQSESGIGFEGHRDN